MSTQYTFAQRTGWSVIACPSCGQTVKLLKGKCPKCGTLVVDLSLPGHSAPTAPVADASVPTEPSADAAARTQTTTQTMVRTYEGSHAQRHLEKDANKLAKDGWSIQSVSDGRKKVGAVRIAALGVFAFAGDKTKLTVVYQRERP